MPKEKVEWNCMQTPETTEETSSHGEEKRVEKRKWQRSAPCAGEKSRADWKKGCKSLEQEENHEKGPRWSWTRNPMGNVNLSQKKEHS